MKAASALIAARVQGTAEPSVAVGRAASDPAISNPATADQAAMDLADWLGRAGLQWGGKILAVVVLLVAAWMVGTWARRSLGRVLERTRMDITLVRFFGNLTRWVIFLMAVVACLGFFGFNITSVAALVGAAGLTVGLALQGSLSNLAAGIMLLILRPFKVGDVVNLAGQFGKIDDIDLFNTKVDTPDNRRLIIPNGQIFGNTIENITHHPWRRCDVSVGTAYAADLRQARAALRRAGEAITRRDPAKPVDVILQNLGSHAVEWTVRVWVPTAEFIACKDELTESVKDHLDSAGVSIPFPQLDLWFRNALTATPPPSGPR